MHIRHLILGMALGCAGTAHAVDTDLLSGLWMETANYPASSIMRFERTESGLAGRYSQVSAPQQHWGFAVGEVVIRGTFSEGKFVGEVLLKPSKAFKPQCPQLETGWQPIEMKLIENGKLYGVWRQTHVVVKDGKCYVSHYQWQPYGLEKIQVK